MSMAEKELRKLKNGNPFTSELTLEVYLAGLKRRFFRVYKEVLNITDYEVTIKQLIEHGIIKRGA